MPFKILYVIFLVACFFYPFEYVMEPIAIRHIIAFILLLMLIGKRHIKFDWVLWMFVAYLFFFVLGALATGYLVTFIPTLVGTYVTCIIMYLATKAMMHQNAGNWILYTLLAIAVLDSVVTIAQFVNSPIARQIADFLRISLIDEDAWDRFETYGGGMGGIVAGGLLRGVKNGYFLCSAVIFSLLSKANQVKLHNVVLCLFLFIALFCAQERAAFFLGIICLVLFILVNTWRKRQGGGIVIFFIAIVAVILIGNIFSDVFPVIELSGTRYATLQGESSGRELFWKKAFNYFSMNPLGGYYDYYANGGYPPHNFIPNSYLNGGIFGGTIVVALVFIQLFICLRVMYESMFEKKHSIVVVVLTLIYLAYTGNSCFHNLCLATGDETAFMWWAILACLLEQEKKKKSVQSQSVGVGVQ